jgi:hypothetical protein
MAVARLVDDRRIVTGHGDECVDRGIDTGRRI